MAKKIEENKENVPKGVKLTSALSFAIAGISLLLGFLFFLGGETISKLTVEQKATLGDMVLPSAMSMVFIGVIFILLTVFLYFVGRDLLNMKKWARISISVFAIIIFLFFAYSFLNSLSNIVSIVSFISQLVILVINGIIIWYLLFNKAITKQFN